MVRVACVMMQKDEGFLIEPWIRYYGYLFGFENLFIFDNGSTLPRVKAILAKFERVGVQVDRNFDAPQHYRVKGDIVSRKMLALRETKHYDMLLPVDCDEFLVWRDGAEMLSERNGIRRGMEQFLCEQRTLGLAWEFLNHPLMPDIYYVQRMQKTMYVADSFLWIDHGFHSAGSRYTNEVCATPFAYVHFHNKPFDMVIRSTLDKFRPFADVDDIGAIERFVEDTNSRRHILPYLYMTEEMYLKKFGDKIYIKSANLQSLLSALGAAVNFPAYYAAHDAVMTEALRSSCQFLPDDFDAQSYLDKNADVRLQGWDPLQHFLIFGYREGRQLA